MRYAVNHKAHSRERIIEAAARQFRGLGTEAVRVADVMRQAGLTHGGFYKHFAGKDQLLEEAICAALEQLSFRILGVTEGMSRPAALRAVIDFYLSEEHLRKPDLGCVLAALGTEIGRMPKPMKRHVSAQLDAYAARLMHLMPGKSGSERRMDFHVLFSSMAGCLMAARAYADEAKQSEILAASRKFFGDSYCSEVAPIDTTRHP